MTEAELARLDKEEMEEVEKTIAAVIALYLLLGVSLEKAIHTLFGKYGVEGRLNLQILRRGLTSDELKNFNAEYGTDYKKITRLNAFLYGLRFEISDLADDYVELVDKLARKIVGMESVAFNFDIDDIDDLILTKWGLDDLNFVDRVNNYESKLFAQLSAEFKRRLALGANVEDVLRTAKKRLEVAKRAVKMLVLTEASAISTTTLREIFKALGVSQYKFYAMEDERTCVECGTLHGKTFLMSNYEVGVTAPPIHTHCRCRIEPLLD